MSFLHSSQFPRGTYIPKSVNGRARVDDKAARMAAEAKAERDCYRAVDARDRMRCRITGVRLALSGAMTTRVQRHHMVKRSRGGAHDSKNVVTVSPHVHALIHVSGDLRLSGDADARDERGAFNGISVEWREGDRWLFHGRC